MLRPGRTVRMTARHRRNLLVLVFAVSGFGLLFAVIKPCFQAESGLVVSPGSKQLLQADAIGFDFNGSHGSLTGDWETVVRNKEKVYKYDRQVPIIFIGGMPRSGTTLMRAMLDSHPMVRCGEETRVVPRILQMVAQWRKSPKESLRLQEAGLSADVIDAGVSAFILEVVARHGEPAPRLCNKDPFTLKSGGYLASMFPSSKFIFMIRDARATVHSIISRKVTITGFDLTNFRQCVQKWNQAVSTMHNQCSEVLGPGKCLPVHYEQLVLHPRQQMERILEFLDLPWNESVLHHEEMIGKPGGVSLSKVERSSDQVIKPLNLEALTSWYNHVPKDVQRDLAELAPMMAILGYDPNDPRPSYGQPDALVKDKTKEILEEAEEWKRKAEALIKGKGKAPFKQEEELIKEIHNPPIRAPAASKTKDQSGHLDDNNNV